MIDRSDCSSLINHSITFEVNGERLRSAVTKVASEYAKKTYVITVRDCVSFTADVARAVGLRVPAVNMTPYGLIEVLALHNPYKDKK